MPDQIKIQKRAKLTGKDNYGTWSTSTEMALMRRKAWKVITGVPPPTPESFGDKDTEKLDAACREWLLETLEDNEVTSQKVTANRKKFKKHLAAEYEQWEELNGIALSEIYDSCTQSVQLLIGKKKNAAEVWKQLKNSFSVCGFASVEQHILTAQDLDYSGCKSLQEFINRLTTAKEHLEALSVFLPQSFYIVQLLRGLGQPFQSWAREVRHRNLDTLDFDDLCAETFAEEQSIKRSETQSNSNRGSAMSTQKDKNKGKDSKKKNKSGQDSDQDFKYWKCRTHKTDDHSWAECRTNPKSENYVPDDKKDKQKKKDNEAKATTLNLEGIPPDLLTQLEARWVQQGSALTTATTTTASILQGDILSADGEQGLGGASVYSWLLDSGATHSMTPYKLNYVTFTRASLMVTVANGETTLAEGYGDILVDLPTRNSAPPVPFLLKDVWYVPKLDCNLLSVPQLLSQGITTVFVAKGGILMKEGKVIASIDTKDRKFWLRTTNDISIAYQKSLAISSLATALGTKGKPLSAKTWHRRLAHLGLDNLRKLKTCAKGISFNDTFDGCQDCIQANYTRRPRRGQTSGLTTRPYEGVHTDVWGPAPVTSHRGCRYLLTIIDDYTRTVKVYCMKLKSQARECFINFENEVKRRVRN
jgi:hypothetical protein